MRSTVYGHFVAGRDKAELKPIVDRLHQHGVKMILDYSMESDLSTEEKRFGSGRMIDGREKMTVVNL